MVETQMRQRSESNRQGGGGNESDDGEDSDEGMARNLLGIRESMDKGSRETHLDTLLHRSSNDNLENLGENAPPAGTGSTISITQLFEPKFLQIFDAYDDHLRTLKGSSRIDLSQHLMSLCLDHLVPFSCWARESTSRCSWIQRTLDDNIDLRPEVRNGLCMVFVYSFSAAKALEGRGESDMFLVLQEPDTGLGIVNKTSLKIYNDPFCFFSFLKACMSGLIDAGKLPENERLNQPKKSKRQVELGEELGAFVQMKSGLVAMFNRGNNDLVREKVRQILAVWQYRAKSIRNRRFATALSVLANPSPSSFLAPDLMTMGPGMGVMGTYPNMTEMADQPMYSRAADHRGTKEEPPRQSNDAGKMFDWRTSSSTNAAPSAKPNIAVLCSSKASSGLMSLINLSSAASNLQPFERPPSVRIKQTPNSSNFNSLSSSHCFQFSAGDDTPRMHPADFITSKSTSDDESSRRSLASLSDAVELTLTSGSVPSVTNTNVVAADSSKGKKRSRPDTESTAPKEMPPHVFSGPITQGALTGGQSQGKNGFERRVGSKTSQSQSQSSKQSHAHQDQEHNDHDTESTDDASEGGPSWKHFNENDFVTAIERDDFSTDDSDVGGKKTVKKVSKASSNEAVPEPVSVTNKKVKVEVPAPVLSPRTKHEKVTVTNGGTVTEKEKEKVKMQAHVDPPSVTPVEAPADIKDVEVPPVVTVSAPPDAPAEKLYLDPPKPVHKQSAAGGAIKSIRFERVAAAEWEMKESRIFNIETLINSTDCVISLVDESKFTSSEIKDLLFTSRSNGFVNLQSELQQRRALIASWPKAEHTNLLDFLTEWRKQESGSQSLIKFWDTSAEKTSPCSGRSSSNATSGRSGGTLSTSSSNQGRSSSIRTVANHDASRGEEATGERGKKSHSDRSSGGERLSVPQGSGVLVYEVVIKVGFIIRASASLDISEAYWRVVYPRDISSNLQAPFATFLTDLFPQLRSKLSKLEDIRDCVVKYCAHAGENEKLSQPPLAPKASCYQTIGTMNESAATMIGRLEANLTIHDFILEC